MQTAYVDQKYCQKRIELVRDSSSTSPLRLYICMSVSLHFMQFRSHHSFHPMLRCHDLSQSKEIDYSGEIMNHSFSLKKRRFKHSELLFGCNFIPTFLRPRKGRNPKKLASTENETSKIAPIREFLQNGLART